MDKKARIFLRIVLGVWVLNLYSLGQVETVGGSMGPPSQAMGAGESQGDQTTEVQMTAKLRDPFWPMGYEPAPETEEPTADAEEVDATAGHVDFSGLTKEEQKVIKSQMVVGGILQQGGSCLAIINNQLLNEGDELELESKGKAYRFAVKKLTTEKILLESMQ